MKQYMKSVMTTALMLLFAIGAWADPTVTIKKQLDGVDNDDAGTVVTSSISEGECTLTVTPASGNYVTVDYITAYAVWDGNNAQAPHRDPGVVDTPIAVTALDANADPSGVTKYKFTVPTDGSDVEVTVNFQSRISATITANNQSVTYNGGAQAYDNYTIEKGPAVVTYYDTEDARTTKTGGTTEAPTNAATYYVQVTQGDNIYTSEPADATFTISPKTLTEGMVELDDDSFPYSGYTPEYSVSVKDGDKDLTGDDYDCVIKQGETVVTPIDAGSYDVVVTGKGNYTGTITKTLTISAASIAEAEVTVSGTYTYTGAAIEPTIGNITVTLNDKDLTAGTDFEIQSYLNNVSAATYDSENAPTVTIKGKGNYSGTVTKTFTIAAKDLASATVTVDPTQTYTYTGSAITPNVSSVSIKLTEGAEAATNLTAGTDYTVTGYANNTNAATATSENAPTVTITGQGNFTGTATGKFTIAQADLSDAEIADIDDQDYTGEAVTPEPQVSVVLIADNDPTVLVKGQDFNYNYENNVAVSSETNTPKVIVTGTGNYTGSAQKTFNIVASYDIWVAGTLVTSNNANNVLGGTEATVSYDEETNTLTLNDATIEPEGEGYGIEYTGTDNLVISLNGTNNVVKGGGNCNAILYDGTGVTAPTLTFSNGGTAPCSLQLEAVGVDLTTIAGFASVVNTGLYRIDDTESLTKKTTITSLGGGSGTAADPIIIKTAEDLRDFAKLVNRGTINTAAMYFRLAPEGGTLDCSGLSESEYKPIGSGSQPFKGTFSGNGCTISNLTAYQGGLFGNISGATIEDLNLSNCTIAGNDYCIAGLATAASNGSKIDLCTITNSTIECLSAQDNPTMGGIVARLSDSETTISNCVVNNTLIKAETTNGTSDTGIAGGIVGEATSGKIENCHIKGESKITDYNNAGATLYAGAIVGKYDGENTTLSGNDYYYDVTVETRKGTDAANKETKDGYTQRALGNGDSDVDGAVMYTKKVTFPTVTGVTITKDGDYYSYDATGINVAPGQTAKMIVEPSAAVKSFTATNVDDTAITSEALAGNKTRYSFEMPDAAVTVTLTMKQDPNLQFVYTWTRLRIGETFSQEVKSDMPTAPAVTWSSSNEAVATVDADGVVTPVAAYNSDIEITATFAGDDTYAPATASYAVRVDKGEQYLRIMYKGKNIPLATVKVAKGNSIDIKNDYDFSCPEELVGSLVWYSNDESVVTVTNGVITTVGCGSTWIKVSSAGNSNYESDYCDFTIEVAPPKPTINLAEGTYLSTHAPITITKENIANTTISYTWDDLTGNNDPEWKNYTDAGVTIQEGTLSARVGYYDAENYNTIYSDTVSVAYTVIIDPELQFIQNDEPVDAAVYTIGATNNLELPVLDNTYGVAVTYESSNTDVATVAADGTVTVVGIGTATITATSAATDVYAAGEASYTLTVNRQLTVSFSTSNEWATYYGTENLSTPEGLKAYQVTAVEGATVTISGIGYIPANTALLLQNVSNNNVWTNIAASAYTGATSTFASNKLIGTASDVDVSTITGGTVYVLYNNMFKRATGGTIPANRGYLVVAPSSGNAPELSITIGDDTTGIGMVGCDSVATDNDEWYTLDGQKLQQAPTQKGLYIKNGKKVVINKK